MEVVPLKEFPKEAYKKMPTKPEGYAICMADYNRWVGRRKAKAKRSREQDFVEVDQNEFIDKKLITVYLDDIKTKLSVDNGKARAIISELENSGHAIYNSYGSWNLTPDGYKKYGEWDVALGIKTKVVPISVKPKTETEVVETKTESVKPKKEWYKMAKDEITYTNLFEGAVEIGKSKAIKVAISQSNAADAQPLLNVREWYLPNGETEMRPTKKGFTFRATSENVEALISQLREAREVL